MKILHIGSHNIAMKCSEVVSIAESVSRFPCLAGLLGFVWQWVEQSGHYKVGETKT